MSMVLGNKHFIFTGERVEGLFQLAQTYYQDRSETSLEALVAEVSPIFRKDFGEYLTMDGDNYYLGKTHYPLPKELLNTIFEYVDKKYPITSLINFWKLCMANPNEHARNKFFKYCQDFGITITDSGYALLYKAVAATSKQKKASSEGLSAFVSESILSVKSKKKSASRFEVWVHDDGSYHLHHEDQTKTAAGTKVGNLQELQNNVAQIAEDEGVRFTPKHNGATYGLDIRLGIPVEMPRDKCDPDLNNACSYGLHIGSYKYVKAFGNSSDVILACLVNPADIVALPNYDHSKIRCCRYFPYAIIKQDENGNWDEIESMYFEDDFKFHETKEVQEYIAKHGGEINYQTVNSVQHIVAKVWTVSEQ